mmetsp:Transcript_8936/g.10226  ORF Transcript_8936/g.10226 Transcript_8936/m.10226 type:complete len:162 (+) Transcript_8936:47-532(+)
MTLGVRLFILGVLLFIGAMLMNIVAFFWLQGTSDRFEILGDRRWRIISFPFLYFGIGFNLIGQYHLCPLCLLMGENVTFDESAPKYQVLLFELAKKGLLVLCRKRDDTETEGQCDPCLTCVEQIERANRIKAIKVELMNISAGLVLFPALLYLPPNYPVWY